MAFDFDYYSIENEKHKREDVYFPVYPTREDEAKGVLPKYVGEHYLLMLICDYYNSAINEYSAFYSIAEDPVDMEIKFCSAQKIVQNMIELYDDIFRYHVAIPSSVISLISSRIWEGNNCSKLLTITNDLLNPLSRNRHHLCFSLAVLKGDGSWTYKPSQDEKDDELNAAWASYQRYGETYSSFEDYLFDWEEERELTYQNASTESEYIEWDEESSFFDDFDD